jgi:hypothetical protein
LRLRDMLRGDSYLKLVYHSIFVQLGWDVSKFMLNLCENFGVMHQSTLAVLKEWTLPTFNLVQNW